MVYLSLLYSFLPTARALLRSWQLSCIKRNLTATLQSAKLNKVGEIDLPIKVSHSSKTECAINFCIKNHPCMQKIARFGASGEDYFFRDLDWLIFKGRPLNELLVRL